MINAGELHSESQVVLTNAIEQNKIKKKKPFVPFSCKKIVALANPWISNVLAANHKHLIVSLTFSAKDVVKSSFNESKLQTVNSQSTHY